MLEILKVASDMMSLLIVLGVGIRLLYRNMKKRQEKRLRQELGRLIDETTGEVDVKSSLGFIYVSIDEAKYDIKTVLYVILAVLLVSSIGQGLSIFTP